MTVSELQNSLNIDESRAIYGCLKTSENTSFYYNGIYYLSAPTFEEFINRNRIKLYEEIIR